MYRCQKKVEKIIRLGNFLLSSCFVPSSFRRAQVEINQPFSILLFFLLMVETVVACTALFHHHHHKSVEGIFLNLSIWFVIVVLATQEEGLRLLSSEDRVTATEFRDISEKAAAASPQSLPYLLIDVRPALETTICCLPNSVNLPFHILEQRLDQLKDLVRQRLPSSSSRTLPGALHIWYLILKTCIIWDF